jgi:hypothetical protein
MTALIKIITDSRMGHALFTPGASYVGIYASLITPSGRHYFNILSHVKALFCLRSQRLFTAYRPSDFSIIPTNGSARDHDGSSDPVQQVYPMTSVRKINNVRR